LGEKSDEKFIPFFKHAFPISMISALLNQGCQIFLGTIHQNGEKYTKLPQNIPNVHKINQIAKN
jgi:hypothetical protein